MRKKRNHPRYVLKIGDVRFASGYASTKVEIMANPNAMQIRVKYLTVGPNAKHHVGEIVRMSRRNLYPTGDR